MLEFQGEITGNLHGNELGSLTIHKVCARECVYACTCLPTFLIKHRLHVYLKYLNLNQSCAPKFCSFLRTTLRRC